MRKKIEILKHKTKLAFHFKHIFLANIRSVLIRLVCCGIFSTITKSSFIHCFKKCGTS